MKVVALHLSRAYSVTKAGLALVGIAALFGFSALPFETEHAPVEVPVAAAGPIHEGVSIAQEREQQALAEFIARRWRIAETAALGFVATAYHAGKVHSVDPVLILAVMAIESRYNPVAESTMGAKGLMQVIPRFHLEKLLDHGGEEALLNPEVNIHVGAQILREYTRRLGDQELALQMYGGAFDDPTAQYAAKVFAERARLEPIRQSARKQNGQSA
jgi:soluble lytic murein transglycosylase-like protein